MLRYLPNFRFRVETVAAHPALVPAGALDVVVVVGGGTTGVETAGTFAEIYHHAGDTPPAHEEVASQRPPTAVEARPGHDGAHRDITRNER